MLLLTGIVVGITGTDIPDGTIMDGTATMLGTGIMAGITTGVGGSNKPLPAERWSPGLTA
jgi:hypothetical protein